MCKRQNIGGTGFPISFPTPTGKLPGPPRYFITKNVNGHCPPYFFVHILPKGLFAANRLATATREESYAVTDWRSLVNCVFLLLALIVALPQSALALTASQVYEQVKDSVVVVKAYDQQGKPVGLGSGVLLPSGDVVTNYHVVEAGVRYTVGRGKQGVPATLKAGDPDKDLCLLTAPGLVAEPARLGKTARLKVGEPVYAVGAPQGLELSLSEGIVSQLRGGPPPLIQTTVAISQGSSGGGLFNAEGELVGITTFYLKDAQSLNFALPVEWIGEVARRKTPERGEIIDNKPTLAEMKAELARRENWEGRAIALKKPGIGKVFWNGPASETKAEPWQRRSAWFFLGLAYTNVGPLRRPSKLTGRRCALSLIMPRPGTTSPLLMPFQATAAPP